MRAFGRDCGCDARRDIIFKSGDIGAPEAALMIAVIAIAVTVSYQLAKRTP